MEDFEYSITAIDLGSSQVKVVIARIVGIDELEIIGTGVAPCTGIKNGGIVNIDATIRSINEAINFAELTAGMEVKDVIVNITGKSIYSKNHKAVVAITNKERIVGEEDIERVIEAAEPRISNNETILHVIAKDFSVDDQSNIKDPIGMTGVRLEAEVHTVTAGITIVSNLEKCIDGAGLGLIDKVLSCFASGEAVLTNSEKELGVAVIDIGAGITDIVMYEEGGICYSGTLPFGGNSITQDISVGLKTPVDIAETIKKKFGHCILDEIDPTQKIEVPSVSGRPSQMVARQNLVAIIEPRVREILEMINGELDKTGKKPLLTGGIILTGGTSLLPGIEEVAEEVFGLAVLTAKPSSLSGLSEKVASPEFSTSVGLIRYISRGITSGDTSREEAVVAGDGVIKKVWRWIENNL
jgi:cell division protein FtsA